MLKFCLSLEIGCLKNFFVAVLPNDEFLFKNQKICADGILQRPDLGLPADWETVEEWLDDSRDVAKSAKIAPPGAILKNPEIPVLPSYNIKPGNEFWEAFPTNYPEGPRRNGVNVEALEELIRVCEPNWLVSEKYAAQKAVARLKGFLPVKFQKSLPGMKERNAKSALENGQAMTYVLATWLKKGFVAGPFERPPRDGFRANPLMAAVQKNKVRPILNLSSPKGCSFNDAVDEHDVSLSGMSSAKIFGEAIRKAGQGAVFSKQDIQDAYKLIPNPQEQWHLYGFEWLGKFFFDTTTVFGSKAAPASFDPLPETMVNIVCTLGKSQKLVFAANWTTSPSSRQKGQNRRKSSQIYT